MFFQDLWLTVPPARFDTEMLLRLCQIRTAWWTCTELAMQIDIKTHPGIRCMPSAFSLSRYLSMKRHPKNRMWFATSQEPKDAPKIRPRMTWSNYLPYVHIFYVKFIWWNPKPSRDFCPRFTWILSCDGDSRRIMRIFTKYRKVWPSAPTRSLSAWWDRAHAHDRARMVRKTWIPGKRAAWHNYRKEDFQRNDKKNHVSHNMLSFRIRLECIVLIEQYWEMQFVS